MGIPGDYDCSGVLFAEQLVLTAGHCTEHHIPTSVIFGSRVQDGRPAKVNKAVPHELYRKETDQSGYTKRVHDVMLLILADKRAVSPAKLANGGQLTKEGFREVRIIGFGATDQFQTEGRGSKRMADIHVVSTDCAPKDDELYGATAGLDFVARDTPKNGTVQDSCGGDSGGPAYIFTHNQSRELAGIVSRGTKNSPPAEPCGDCGIYERIPEELEWIRHVAQKNGVKPP